MPSDGVGGRNLERGETEELEGELRSSAAFTPGLSRILSSRDV